MYGFDGFCVFHPYKISLAKEKKKHQEAIIPCPQD